MNIDPKEFSCMDDSPFNNGWGYNWNYEEDEPEEIVSDEEDEINDDE